MSYKYLQKVTKSYLNLFFLLLACRGCLFGICSLFGFSEETNSFALAMLSPYYSRALSDEAVRLYSPRTGVTSGVFLNLHSWIAKGNVSDIAIVDDSCISQAALNPVIAVVDDATDGADASSLDVISEGFLTPQGKRSAPLNCDAPRKKKREDLEFET